MRRRTCQLCCNWQLYGSWIYETSRTSPRTLQPRTASERNPAFVGQSRPSIQMWECTTLRQAYFVAQNFRAFVHRGDTSNFKWQLWFTERCMVERYSTIVTAECTPLMWSCM